MTIREVTPLRDRIDIRPNPMPIIELALCAFVAFAWGFGLGVVWMLWTHS